MSRRASLAVFGALTIAIHVLAVPSPVNAGSAKIDSRKVTSISLTPMTTGKNGAALGIKVNRRRGQSLPPFVVVRYNDQLVRLERTEIGKSYALYTVKGQVPEGKPPLKPTVVPVKNGETPPEKIGCSIGIVKCPPGCKSVLFGSDCVVCIVFQCDTSPYFPSVN